MEKTALIIIDVQSAIKKMAPKTAPYSWEELEANNRRLVDSFYAAGLPVYLVSVQPKALLFKTAKEAFGDLLLKDMLASRPDMKQLVKTGPSAFNQSDYPLESELKRIGVEKILVTGVSMDNGVLKTILDGHALGFEVATVLDASASRIAANFETAVAEIAELGQTFMTEELL